MIVYLGVVILVACSLLIGAAISILLGEKRVDARAGLVGFAVLLVAAPAAARLPNGGLVIPAILLLVLGASAATVLRRGRAGLHPVGWVGVAVIAGALAITAIPFYATSRVGLLGVSFNNDTAVHLVWAEGLRSDTMRQLYGTPEGYPLGPHAVLAGFGSLTSIDLDRLLTSMLVAIPILTSLAVLDLLRSMASPLRVVAALLVAFGYLLSGYYGQGAFKESIHVGLLVVFTGGLQRLLDGPPEGRARAAMGLGLIVAAAVQTYSYLALVWYVGAIGIALALLFMRSPRRSCRRGVVRITLTPLLAGAGVFVVALLPELPRLLSFFQQFGASPSGSATGIATTNLGNLAGPLPFAETLGIWPSQDFRLPVPAGAFFAVHTLQVAIGAAAICGVLFLFRQRQVALSAVGLGALAVWFLSDGRQSPYVTAKALVVMTPFVVALALRGLLDDRRAGASSAVAVAGRASRIAMAAVLATALAWSSFGVLRSSAVESTSQRDELLSLRGSLRGGETLFLGIDDHVGWRLRNVPVAYLGYPVPPIPLPLDPAAKYAYGRPLDFDSVAPADLDRFRYVIVNRSAYSSSPPASLRLLQRTRSFELYLRTGPTPQRDLPPKSVGQPGADLRCPQRDGVPERRAIIFPGRPVLSGGAGALSPGAASSVPLTLPRGDWDLALSYVSMLKVRVVLPDHTWVLPASTGRPGNYVGFGRVHSNGHLPPFTVIADRASRLTGASDIANVGSIAAVPVGPKRTVGRRSACGRYVDRLLP